jgi:hypothetical protein
VDASARSNLRYDSRISSVCGIVVFFTKQSKFERPTDEAAYQKFVDDEEKVEAERTLALLRAQDLAEQCGDELCGEDLASLFAEEDEESESEEPGDAWKPRSRKTRGRRGARGGAVAQRKKMRGGGGKEWLEASEDKDDDSASEHGSSSESESGSGSECGSEREGAAGEVPVERQRRGARERRPRAEWADYVLF